MKTQLVNFAIRRIQERESLPDVSDVLMEKIKRLSKVILTAPDEFAESTMVDLLQILSGVPAKDSMPILVGLMSRHRDLVLRHVGASRGTRARIDYLDRLELLSELFAVQRVGRIAETARYMESWL